MAKQTNIREYYTSSPIDGTSAGTSVVETPGDPDPGVDPIFNTMGVSIFVNTMDNVLVPPVVSIGTNHPNYDNLVKLQLAGGLLGLTEISVEPGRPRIADGTVIKCKVVTPAVKLNPLAGITFEFTPIVWGFDTY